MVRQGLEARVESLIFEEPGGWVQLVVFEVPQERWARLDPPVLERLWG